MILRRNKHIQWSTGNHCYENWVFRGKIKTLIYWVQDSSSSQRFAWQFRLIIMVANSSTPIVLGWNMPGTLATAWESLKQATKWSAFYFTHPNSYYLLPQTNVPLRNIPMMKRLPVRAMSKEVQDLMHHWASKHGKAVRQLTIHQTTHSIQ